VPGLNDKPLLSDSYIGFRHVLNYGKTFLPQRKLILSLYLYKSIQQSEPSRGISCRVLASVAANRKEHNTHGIQIQEDH
jgi:hypothetical protein